MSEAEQPELARLTVELLSAYVANNTVQKDELAGLIETTRAALSGVSNDRRVAKDHTPAVSIEDSLASPEHIVSLIDGKPYKTLKRHLGNNGLTADEYKARYKLPADYPLVAPSYSAHRRKVAKNMGLGGRPASSTSAKATEAPIVSADAAVVRAKSAVANSNSKGSAKSGPAAAAKPKKSVSAKAREPQSPATQAVADAPSVKLPVRSASELATTTTTSIAPEALQKAAKQTRRMARAKNESSANVQGEAASTGTPAPAPVKTRKKLGISTATKVSVASASEQPGTAGKVEFAKNSPSPASKTGAPRTKAKKSTSKQPSAKRAEAGQEGN
ncbi:MucR family transcriptional regulator [Novosphingobium sp. YAF33]|uniref:MucR family transcriptional regulator n=1 Tax=Novosphingobium sp. YAF33 TaxID=3233082 RepID=UPI003F99B49E